MVKKAPRAWGWTTAQSMLQKEEVQQWLILSTEGMYRVRVSVFMTIHIRVDLN